MKYIVANDCLFGYPIGNHNKRFFSMVVMAVDALKGGDPLLIDRDTLVDSQKCRYAEDEDFERFRIRKPREYEYNDGINEGKTMKKNTMKLDEARLSRIVAECMKKVLREWEDTNDEYWKGGPTIYDTVANIKVYSAKADAVAENAFNMEDGEAKKKELDSLQNWWFPTLYTYCKSFVETWEKMRPNM